MAAIVVDASVALAWALPDEASVYAEAVLTVVESDGLHVPELWPREVANGIAMAYVRQRITGADEQAFIAALSRLAIEIDRPTLMTVIRDGIAAARLYGFTAYDAAYVELAARERLRLATLDKRMRAAAVIAGVSIFEVQRPSQ